MEMAAFALPLFMPNKTLLALDGVVKWQMGGSPTRLVLHFLVGEASPPSYVNTNKGAGSSVLTGVRTRQNETEPN
jgi:hypothetical protein